LRNNFSLTYIVVLPSDSPYLPALSRINSVLSWPKLRRHELLFWLDAKEVVDVVKLLVLDEQRVAAEARAVGENNARTIRIGDLDVVGQASAALWTDFGKERLNTPYNRSAALDLGGHGSVFSPPNGGPRRASRANAVTREGVGERDRAA
jgi:hypothetical protein